MIMPEKPDYMDLVEAYPTDIGEFFHQLHSREEMLQHTQPKVLFGLIFSTEITKLPDGERSAAKIGVQGTRELVAALPDLTHLKEFRLRSANADMSSQFLPSHRNLSLEYYHNSIPGRRGICSCSLSFPPTLQLSKVSLQPSALSHFVGASCQSVPVCAAGIALCMCCWDCAVTICAAGIAQYGLLRGACRAFYLDC